MNTTGVSLAWRILGCLRQMPNRDEGELGGSGLDAASVCSADSNIRILMISNFQKCFGSL